jgi:hypothetical protein
MYVTELYCDVVGKGYFQTKLQLVKATLNLGKNVIGLTRVNVVN